MNEEAKKTALRMIPYGLYVLTAEGKNGAVAAATVNWVTQAAFAPPLVVLGVKTDSGAHAIIKETGEFALNILGKGQQAIAFRFFKPSVAEEGRLSMWRRDIWFMQSGAHCEPSRSTSGGSRCWGRPCRSSRG